MQVLQKAHIKIMACAIYNCLFFSYTDTLLFWWKIKSYCDCCFPQKLDSSPLFSDIYYEAILV